MNYEYKVPLYHVSGEQHWCKLKIIKASTWVLCFEGPASLKIPVQFEGDTVIECLDMLREILESYDYLIGCNGARIDVWQNGLIADMSDGQRAWLAKSLDEKRYTDAVNIFESVSRDKVVSLKEHREFMRKWKEKQSQL